ncbi:hypothetical protein DFJ74DRAFT_648214 [Hyaloraphidium curvatum]|nr:hypothetical protein DFJ74DRAFT_648214 [Hyaloraphidium curvatum]
MDVPEVLGSVQAQVNHLCLPHTPAAVQFVSEWLLLASLPGMVDDSPGSEPEHPRFAGHRHDQAVFSLTAKKWGLEMSRDPTEWGEKEMEREGYGRDGSGPYPLTFNHHRIKD